MCRRHDQAIPEDLLSHFYRLLVKGLNCEDNKIVVAIIMNCTELFSLDLTGSFILIPTFLRTIRRYVHSF